MAKNLMVISLILFLVSACGSKPTYEDATKWHSKCHTFPRYHPGDLYAYEDKCTQECAVTLKCDGDKTTLPTESSKDYSSCAGRLNTCIIECIEKIHPIAVHVEGGYYSDGSYFAQCYYFENIHPTKDTYEKTKWQKDRDECIELTFENVKPKFWEQGQAAILQKEVFIDRAKKYYRECLKERGYSIYLY